MYLNHFGLQKSPFDSSPDPSIFYPSGTHQAAQRALIQGIESRVGLMWLLGLSGLGKTTVLRSVAERLDPESVRVIWIPDSDLSYRGLLEVIYAALGVERPKSPGLIDLGHQLFEALLKEYDHGRNVVLMIDDIQTMPVRTLASVQQFQNLEKDGRKLLQVILSGREPEFGNILRSERLKPLRHKMIQQTTIVPLTREESMEYVRFRVSAVGGVKKFPFTQTALRQIVDHCRGNPKHLNLFCDRALEAGWLREENPVGVTTVRDVVAGLLSIDADAEKTAPRSSVGIAIVLMASLWLITLGLTFFRESRPAVGKHDIATSVSYSLHARPEDSSSSGAGGPGAEQVERTSLSMNEGTQSPMHVSGRADRHGVVASGASGIDHPRIDRLAGGTDSGVFWVYGPRDLPGRPARR